MSQNTSGIRSILSLAGGYSLLQRVVGADRSRRILSESFIRATPGMRILDIGCGTGDILDYLPEVDYLGVDLNPRYIEAAIRRHGSQGAFLSRDIRDEDWSGNGDWDRVLAMGILHHLEDNEALHLLRVAKRRLKPDGKLVTFDSCFVPGQSLMARFLINQDRGRNTRSEGGYRDLASQVFDTVDLHIRQDLLHVPYTHAIMICSH